MNDEYFKLKLTDGSILVFDKQCNSIDYSNSKYCICKHLIDERRYETLAIIPHSSVFSIIKMKETEIDDTKSYKITLEGCDDNTVFKMELTDDEYELVKKISVKANAMSTYDCEPRMYVEEG